MNMTQKKYTLKRIEEIAKEKRQKIFSNKVATPEPEAFEFEAAVKALRKGPDHYEINKRIVDTYNNARLNSVIFPLGYQAKLEFVTKARERLDRQKDLATSLLNILVPELCDSIMLGGDKDAEAALKRIAAFKTEF